MSIPRPEYPRPQFVRDDWLCLNGPWQFEIDPGDSGLERGLKDRDLAGQITVPFCPESALSGIGNTDFLNAVWYRHQVRIPDAWAGRRVLLHFQAVDYDATVWADGREVGRHRGGFTPLTCDLGLAEAGRNITLVVRARDDHREPKPQGKQCPDFANRGCLYGRTTGIWQTVWLEPVPPTHLLRPRITPDLANRCFRVVQPIGGPRAGIRLRATLRDEQGEVCQAIVPADRDFTPCAELRIPEDRVQVWDVGNGTLYDVDLELTDAAGDLVDRARSYAGLRSITLAGPAVQINGRTVFQRLVLDQGYYPDGLMTAPSDDALLRDIELSQAAGFNGARLHQKVFEERFLYHADRMGYLVWGEFADWPGDLARRAAGEANVSQVTQWLEVLLRDYSHPCILGWCSLNETHDRLGDRIAPHDDRMLGAFLAAKAMDPTRLVLDTSGYSHRVAASDVWDCHDYEQDVETFRARHAGLAQGRPFANAEPTIESVPYAGQPFFVSEFGGIWWNPEAAEDEDSWGYGNRPKDIEEFYARFEGLCGALLDNARMFGYCYTQLTDVFQEQNGIYRFDRSAKFDLARLRDVQQRTAAIEQQRA
ncbi:MAG: beta-galactosidase [Phycisphaerae bacterium]|nr:beta-galactosidase [Phycisphaerae bacterium]